MTNSGPFEVFFFVDDFPAIRYNIFAPPVKIVQRRLRKNEDGTAKKTGNLVLAIFRFRNEAADRAGITVRSLLGGSHE